MKISFIVQTPDGYQTLAKTSRLDKALDILEKIKADGVLLDADTAKSLFAKCSESAPKLGPRTHITAKTHLGIQRIPLNEIYYFQADQKYVTAHHSQGTLLLEDTLKELENEFIDHFIRIHRTLLVNISEIDSIQKDDNGFYWLKMRHQETLFPISRRKIALVKRRL